MGLCIVIIVLLTQTRDREILCPESITYGPVLKIINRNEILIATGYDQKQNLKMGDSFKITEEHSQRECKLINIGETKVTFECDMGCVFFCSGEYKSKFDFDVPILKDITYNELKESDYGPLRRQYFYQDVYNCSLYRIPK